MMKVIEDKRNNLFTDDGQDCYLCFYSSSMQMALVSDSAPALTSFLDNTESFKRSI